MKQELTAIPGVEAVFRAPFFNEIVVRLNKPVEQMLKELAARKIQGGYALGQKYPELSDCLLICATETKTTDDIKLFAKHLRDVLEGRKLACPA